MNNLLISSNSTNSNPLKRIQLTTINADEAHGIRFIQACTDADSKLSFRLLQEPRVKLQAAIQGNQAFLIACQKGMGKLALALLKISEVRALAAANNNLALKYACELEIDALVLQLLSLPSVRALAANYGNQALFYLFNKGYEKAALKLMHEPQVTNSLSINFESTLLRACELGFGKLAMHLLEHQYPVPIDESIFYLAKKNRLYKVALRLLRNPKIATKVSDQAYIDLIDNLIYLKNRRLAFKILQHPRMLANFSYIHYVEFCEIKWSKLIVLLINKSSIRDKLVPHAIGALEKAVDLSLDKVAIKLLSYPEFVAQATFDNNFFLSKACQNSMLNLALKLLTLDTVKEDFVSHINTEFVDLDEELDHPNNNVIIHLLNQEAMQQVIVRMLTLRELAGINELPGTLEFTEEYFIYACKLRLGKLANQLWDNPILKVKLSNYQNFFWAVCYGLSNLAIKMLQVSIIAEKAASRDNVAFIMACYRNQKKLAFLLLDLPAVQENVGAQQHLALQGACSFDLKNDNLICNLLQYSALPQCLENNNIMYPQLGTVLPFAFEINEDVEIFQEIATFNSELHSKTIFDMMRNSLFTCANKITYNLNLVLAFKVYSKPWVIEKYAYNNQESLVYNSLQTKIKKNLNEQYKAELLSSLYKVKKSLHYYFPLTILSMHKNTISYDLIHQILTYDNKKGNMHLRYAAKQFSKNSELRKKLTKL